MHDKDKVPAKPGKSVLTVENLCFTDFSGVNRVKDVSFNVRSGEILGIAGVSGNGQSELLASITGIQPLQKGKLKISSETITPAMKADAADMRRFGMAHVPEDRQRMGLVTSFSANENSILGYHKDPAYNGLFESDVLLLHLHNPSVSAFTVCIFFYLFQFQILV